jgi:hypothetical protein
MGITVAVLPRVGQRFVMAVQPRDWYAGRVGDGAVVGEATTGAVYVLFDTGLRESFPPARFAEYFKPAVFETREENGPRADRPRIERTPSGRILFHR